MSSGLDTGGKEKKLKMRFAGIFLNALPLICGARDVPSSSEELELSSVTPNDDDSHSKRSHQPKQVDTGSRNSTISGQDETQDASVDWKQYTEGNRSDWMKYMNKPGSNDQGSGGQFDWMKYAGPYMSQFAQQSKQEPESATDSESTNSSSWNNGQGDGYGEPFRSQTGGDFRYKMGRQWNQTEGVWQQFAAPYSSVNPQQPGNSSEGSSTDWQKYMGGSGQGGQDWQKYMGQSGNTSQGGSGQGGQDWQQYMGQSGNTSQGSQMDWQKYVGGSGGQGSQMDWQQYMGQSGSTSQGSQMDWQKYVGGSGGQGSQMDWQKYMGGQSGNTSQGSQMDWQKYMKPYMGGSDQREETQKTPQAGGYFELEVTGKDLNVTTNFGLGQGHGGNSSNITTGGGGGGGGNQNAITAREGKIFIRGQFLNQLMGKDVVPM